MNTQHDDKALVMRAWRGDETAFDEIGHRYGPVLHALILGHGGETGAEETRHAILDKARQKVEGLEDPASIGPWLVTLVRDFAPRRGPGARGEAGTTLGAVRALGPGARDALLLRFLAGLPGWQIARLLGEPVEDVRRDLQGGASKLVREDLSPAAAGWLWDPQEPRAPQLERVATDLGRHRLATKKPRGGFPWRLAYGALGVLILAGIAAFFLLKPADDPEGWRLVWTRGVEGASRLAAGEAFETGEDQRARLSLEDGATVDVEPSSRVVAEETERVPGRLQLSHGAIAVETGEETRSLVVETEAGSIVDLGASFLVELPRDGDGFVRVTSGEVRVETLDRAEVSVPAGAMARLRRGDPAVVPYFEDAPEPLHEVQVEGDGPLVAAMSAERPRDAITLFHLLRHADDETRALIAVRLDELVPRPEGVEEASILALDPEALAAWMAVIREDW